VRVSASCHDSFPSPAAHTQQIFWSLVEVARRGVQVRLHCREGRNGQQGQQGRVRAGLLGEFYGMARGAMPGTFSVHAHSGAGFPRWFAQASFDVRAPSVLSRDGADLVWTRNVAAALWLTRAGLPTIFETYRPDLATDWRFAAWRGAVLGSPALRGVIHHSRLADLAFARAGVPDSRRLVATNGFAPEWMEPPLERDAARRALGIALDRPLVVYAGDLHRAKGIGALLRLAARVPEADMLLVGAEDDDAIRRTQALASRAGALNVTTRPRVPIGSLAPYLYAADCLVIPPPDEPIGRSRTVLPIKVFLYLAAGRAILAPRRPDLEEVLTDGVTARLFVPGDDGSAADALNEILGDQRVRDRLGREALRVSEAHTWAKRAERIVGFFERVR
jgi:glycosyltransferase involved in cell wall biosynthesis